MTKAVDKAIYEKAEQEMFAAVQQILMTKHRLTRQLAKKVTTRFAKNVRHAMGFKKGAAQIADWLYIEAKYYNMLQETK